MNTAGVDLARVHVEGRLDPPTLICLRSPLEGRPPLLFQSGGLAREDGRRRAVRPGGCPIPCLP